MEVRADLPDHKTRPGIRTAVLLQSRFEQFQEFVEHIHVRQAAVDLFGADFIVDRRKAPGLAETFDVRDQFDGPGGHHLDLNDFSLRKGTVHGGIHMDQFISGQKRSLIGLLDGFHGFFIGPFLQGLDVLQPGSAVVDRGNEGAGVVVSLRFHLHHANEVFLCHAGVTTVAVHLVECRREQNRSVVSFGSAERGLDDCGRIRTYGQQGHGFVALGCEFLHPVEQSSEFWCLVHISLIIIE